MSNEEFEHNHIKGIAEKYVQESWGSFLDLDSVDLIQAGIGVGKIISKEKDERIAELEQQIEQLQRVNSEQKETLKKVRIALIQERTANIVNYGKGGVEMFEDMLEVLKGVSN